MDKINVIGQMDNTVDHTLESANRVYGSDGIAPTVPTCGGGNIQPKVLEVEVIGGMGEQISNNGTQYYQQDRVYNTETISPALNACGEGLVPKVVDCVAMRGRNPENPSDRRKGIELEQRLEVNTEGIANTITTVQKDNMVLIRQATKDGVIPCRIGGVADMSYPDSLTRRGRVIENGEISPTLTTENIPNVLERWIWEIDGQKYLIRIRKLTPRECWRLMDFSDEDFEKAQAVNSNTQLYKQAGNSIVKNVLCEVFKELIE
jgi:DNA (cytosine-5)-methyltransferase 1